MATQSSSGRRIRRLREQHGMSQVAVSRSLGISASYLNLIEHDRRPLSLPLVAKLAAHFQVEPTALSAGEDARLLAELREVFAEPTLRDTWIEPASVEALVESAPEAGRAILALHRAYRSAAGELRTVSERLAEHPDLANARHELVTLLTSLRSFAEILRDNPDLAPERRDQFTEVMVGESTRLAEVLEQHFAFITGDGLRHLSGSLAPAEEIGDLLQAQRNHFPPLEQAAEDLARALGLTQINSAERLIEALGQRHGVSVEFVAPAKLPGRSSQFLPASTTLALSQALEPASAVFRMASCLALLSGRGAIDEVCGQAGFGSDEARALCRQVCANYLAAALLMPYDGVLSAAGELRHDLDLIARRFGASFEQVCQRLTSLQRPGAEGVPFHFLRVDVAGNLSKRFSASGLPIARHDGVCPRWNVHHALVGPGRTDRQIIALEDGGRYFTIARSLAKPSGVPGIPERRYSIALGCELSFAPRLIYADGLALDQDESVVPAGIHCRLCRRHDCQHRAFRAQIG